MESQGNLLGHRGEPRVRVAPSNVGAPLFLDTPQFPGSLLGLQKNGGLASGQDAKAPGIFPDAEVKGSAASPARASGDCSFCSGSRYPCSQRQLENCLLHWEGVISTCSALCAFSGPGLVLRSPSPTPTPTPRNSILAFMVRHCSK